MEKIGWKTRLAIVVSAIWLGLGAAISRNESDSLSAFLILGVVPLAILWGIAWVWAGFRNARPKKESKPNSVAASAPANKSEPTPRNSLLLWIGVIITIASVALLSYAFSQAGANFYFEFGRLLGFYFWVPLVAYFIWKRKFQEKRGMGIFLFSILFLSIAGYESAKVIRESQDARRFLVESQTMYLKLLNGEEVQRPRSNEFGEFTPLLMVTHDLVADIAGEFKSLGQDLEGARERLLAPKALQTPASIRRSQDELLLLRKRLDEAEKRINDAYNDFPRMIDEATIEPRFKIEFQRGAEKGMRNGKIALSNYFRIERDLIEQIGALLLFLQQKSGKYEYRGDKLLFASESDLNQFNQHVQKLQALELEEAEWQRSAMATSIGQIRSIQNLTKSNSR